MTYDPATNTATFHLPTNLPDGNYHLTIPASNIADGVGHHPASDVQLDFFFLAGDANHDARVNLADFNVLAGNFGQSPRTFSQGDFNYDTVVNLTDFNILAGRFGQVLAADGFASTPIGGTRSGETIRELLEELT